MAAPVLHEFKRQASFFLKEKIKTARLALTDVTPAELLTEEAINESPLSPDASTMAVISRAAFEVDDYQRIVEILHRRFLKFDRKSWRASYNALVLLEHLLTHGPLRVAEEFHYDKQVINEMENFQYIDEKGFNWGLSVKKLSERVTRLLEEEPFLKEERARARKLTHGIKGFGSFSHRSSLTYGTSTSLGKYLRCNSHYNDHQNPDNDDSRSLKRSFSMEEEDEAGAAAGEAHEDNSFWAICDGDGYATEEDHPFCNNKLEASASLLSII